MPKIVTSRHWTIRIHLIPGILDGIAEYCGKLPALLCVREAGESAADGIEHVHILASFPTERTKPDLIKDMKTHFKDTVFAKHNFAYSVWESYGINKDLEEYLCKGPSKTVQTKPTILYRNWLDDVDVHHANWWAKHNEILKKKSSKKKITEHDRMFVVERVNEKLQMLIDEDVAAGRQNDREWTYRLASKLVLEHYKGKVNDNIAFPVLQAVLYKHYPESVERSFMDRMRDKFKYVF